ncbi:MAG: hypothetical protein J6N72_07795 [Psychrobacter sp.]|uniref:Uncharacterized protein n=1 Tax=Psychrobacter communis TaxID=2762238 RepID=A0ABR8RH19_9GAMM|nr:MULTISPECIES: hypothetical protein [Psychrobacter]MBD7947088.1 hypothetical protein [Psychrobacter communis]MBO6225334.1 hypothetical protein [Psychrobacter sp.]HCT74800.1 hypothetical protein [Psychrobacter sp.]
MGMLIGVIIVLFVLGSMMALKPNGIDQRLDKLRMTARRLQLNPKLVSCPDWIKGKDNEYGRGMLGQYCLVLDDMQLPHTRYQVIDGQWRPDSRFVDTSTKDTKLTIPSAIRSSQNNTKTDIKKPNFSLDKMPIDLPVSIEPFVKGLLTKANSIVIYWEDIAYVRPSTNPAYQQKLIEADLLALKENLEKWALQMQKKS